MKYSKILAAIFASLFLASSANLVWAKDPKAVNHLKQLDCATGEVAMFDGANWVCADTSLPVEADPGDLLYWDGSVWQLTPAPPTVGCGDPSLTLTGGIPTWTAPGVFNIGDEGPAGGIVFYITDGGCHGLEAAPADLSVATIWGCQGTPLTGADGTGIGAGAQNTLDIQEGCAGTDIAARVAASYGPGWFLPSRDELDLLFYERAYVGGFVNFYYWSSSEYDANSAWVQCFDDSCVVGPEVRVKSFPTAVRPVKRF